MFRLDRNRPAGPCLTVQLSHVWELADMCVQVVLTATSPPVRPSWWVLSVPHWLWCAPYFYGADGRYTGGLRLLGLEVQVEIY